MTCSKLCFSIRLTEKTEQKYIKIGRILRFNLYLYVVKILELISTTVENSAILLMDCNDSIFSEGG